MKNSELETLNFKVNSIETFLGIAFKGETIADKQGFVAQHWDERVIITGKLLSDSYSEYVNGKVTFFREWETTMELKEKNIYRIDHYFNKDHDRSSIFVETELDANSIVNIIGCIHFRFEELIDESASMDEKHLLNILTRFYGVKDVTKDCQKYLPYIKLPQKDWDLINAFEFTGLDGDTINIIQIDWYEARELCCGKHYKELMVKWLPLTKEFDGEIRNLKDLYPLEK